MNREPADATTRRAPAVIAARSLREVVLEKVRYAIEGQLDRGAPLDDYRFDVVVNQQTRELFIRLERDLLGRHEDQRWEDVKRSSHVTRTESQVIAAEEVPRSWWDHLKHTITTATGFGRPNPRLPELWSWTIRYRTITTRIKQTTRVESTQHSHHVRTTRVCPHLHVADFESRQSRVHLRWLAGEDDQPRMTPTGPA